MSLKFEVEPGGPDGGLTIVSYKVKYKKACKRSFFCLPTPSLKFRLYFPLTKNLNESLEDYGIEPFKSELPNLVLKSAKSFCP